MEFNKYPINTFETLVMGAGVLLTNFDPTTGTVTDSNILGPTSGGINFTATPTYKDFGEDIDNVPKNTKELKRIEDWEIKMTGTLIAITAQAARWLAAAADMATLSGWDGNKIVPRDTLDITDGTGDFRDIWLVADYSDKNTGTNAGFVAIRVMNALSTGGFQIQTADKEKGQFSFEFTAHYSKDAQDTVPFELYIRAGVNP